MDLTILGSGTNVHRTRAAAGYLVQTDQTLLLDFGPRTLMNLIKTGVDRHRITFRISLRTSSTRSSTPSSKGATGRH
jgi:ribonuclease BN (tRNA processing enzyme)